MEEIGEFIRMHREVLLKEWLSQSLEMYPKQSRSLMLNNRDPFSNPISSALAHGLEQLLGELCGDEKACPEKALTELGRLLGVQEMPPSKCLGFIFGLKPLLIKMATSEGRKGGFKTEELKEFELWIEQRTLGLFDQYMEHRERIYQLKGDEMKQKNYMLLRRASS